MSDTLCPPDKPTADDAGRRPSEAQLAAIVEEAFILEAVRR